MTLPKIREAGGDALLVKADIADPAATIALFDAAQKACGSIDLVVNSAGVMNEAKSWISTTPRSIELWPSTSRVRSTCRAKAARRVRDGGRVESDDERDRCAPADVCRLYRHEVAPSKDSHRFSHRKCAGVAPL